MLPQDLHLPNAGICLRVRPQRAPGLRNAAEYEGDAWLIAGPHARRSLSRHEIGNVEQPDAAGPLATTVPRVVLGRTEAEKPKHASEIDAVRVGVLSLR